MSFVCLWIPAWSIGAGPSGASGDRHAPGNSGTDLAAALLTITPHAVVEACGVIWVDARGLEAFDIARRALDLARRYTSHRISNNGHTAGNGRESTITHDGSPHNDAPRAGIASTAIAAEVAARHGGAPIVTVPVGTDAAFLAPFPLAVLTPSLHLAATLQDVGLVTCGDLAHLTAEAVEVRLGAEGLALWRLARADDSRQIFMPAPRALPSASLAWEEYVLRDPEQLVFIANRLVTTICAELRAWGEAARALALGLTLADRSEIVRPLHASRDTANRAVWMRLIRLELDRLQLSEGVVGLSVRVESTGAAGARQGDVFDRGFGTARAVDHAITQLVDDGTAALVEPAPTAHPLPDRRMAWRVREPNIADARPERTSAEPWSGTPRLLLQLFPEPQQIDVVTTGSRAHPVPTRFRTFEGHDAKLLTALGPDHVSAGAETGTATGAPYAREYFTCLTENGLLVLLYRDALADVWYLHGWWD